MDKAWKRDERKVSEFFGCRRNPLSGSNSGVTGSDTRHPRLYIEQKRRKRHSVVALWDEVAERAAKEGKVPVVTLTEHGRSGFWVLVHARDLRRVAEIMGGES